jgi:hypothetical protein
MNVVDWAPVQYQMGKLLIALGGPHDLMMFYAESEERATQDIYIGLPQYSLLSSFPGFQEI